LAAFSAARLAATFLRLFLMIVVTIAISSLPSWTSADASCVGPI
jgi:hypothetical protein